MAEYVVEEPSSQSASWRVHERIVRCRDCKHYCEHEWVMVTDVSDVCHFFGDGVKVEPDGFCAWGERKEVDA